MAVDARTLAQFNALARTRDRGRSWIVRDLIRRGAKAARITEGRMFRPVAKGGQRLNGDAKTPQSIRNVVKGYARALGWNDLAPHDLRRTFAKLAHKGGAPIEQIQLSRGHASIRNTMKYLGVEQDLADALRDRLGLRLG